MAVDGIVAAIWEEGSAGDVAAEPGSSSAAVTSEELRAEVAALRGLIDAFPAAVRDNRRQIVVIVLMQSRSHMSIEGASEALPMRRRASMNIFSLNQTKIKSSQAIIFRNVHFCVSWAILLVVAAVVWGAGGASAIGLTGLFFFVYTFQALAAEVLGARVSSYNISAPRRFPFLPTPLVMWRIEGSLKTIESVVSISDNCACLNWLSGIHTTLIFSDRDRKRRFFSLLRQLEPDIDLRKGR